MKSKSTLVILPGWGGCKETWHDFIKKSEVDFNVLCIDLPCFGKEPCPKEIWGIEEYSNFVKNKIQKINRQSKTVIIGHSFGGAVATHLIAHNPNIVDKLVLTGAAIIRPKIVVKKIILGSIAKIGKVILKFPFLNKFENTSKKMLYKISGSQDYNNSSGIKREIYKKIIKQDQQYLLQNLKLNTLLIWGEKDKMTPLKHGKKILARLPNAKLKIIKNGSHGLHHPKYLEKFYREIKTFI